MDRDCPIGVFDSGVGGLSILRALRAELPHEDFVYFSDAGHAPYGEKGEAFVSNRSLAIAVDLLEQHRIKGLVVACNTATAAAVHLLRARHTQLPVIGVEPALKPASALTRTGRVAVLATRGTLSSAKFQALLTSLRHQADFVLVPCDGLAAAVEAGDEARIRELCRRYTVEVCCFGSERGEIDTVVLGCTHYPFAEEVFRELLGPSIQLVETGQPVARQTRRLLSDRGLLSPDGSGRVEWRTSGAPEVLQSAAARWLGLDTAGSPGGLRLAA
ncbi:glutamate racemase [Ramlibacter monticola]|uniref:Glutamate racemase n=1 Tax=Ramlibacter monticola TaxID=1926872 RepID=A0A936ZA02_9BURK|nr:glutamate racemase [Ramlibacter monticola]MBL0394930.1 glutamate racemase [Ramlibacter monticola]